MDKSIREVERQAATGDTQAQARLEQYRCRIGEHCGCHHGIRGMFENHHAVFGDSYQDQYEETTNGRLALVLYLGEGEREALLAKAVMLCHRLGIEPPRAGSFLQYDCSYCGAAPGEHCTTRSGKQAAQPHVARSRGGCPVIEEYGPDNPYDYDYHGLLYGSVY
jgi:hypothetical protein